MKAVVKNLSGAKKSLKGKGDKFLNDVKKQVAIVGRNVELKAKQEAPVEFGNLRDSIFYESMKEGMSARVTANVFYAPYQEFGTGGEVSIPQGFEDLALPFKTGNNTMSMPAQPYLIPSAKEGFEDLKKRLKALT